MRCCPAVPRHTSRSQLHRTCPFCRTGAGLKVKRSLPYEAMLCAADFEAHAREVLSKEAWDFYAGGANNEQTLRDNVAAFSR